MQDTFSSLAYGKLLGISRNMLKTDVVNMLAGYNLSLEDVRVDYNRAFRRMGMLTDRSGTILLPMMEKLSFPESSKFATVRCTSQTESIYALLAKKKGPCQNGQILMRVLQ
ncbi:hypothetical protein C1H46_018000 [Malus baccata]|uniref:Uncharacterized protein n=1 Tax=Malus baccata TaxID=106549 RepID=A0A540MCA8_MALBA|nr:hypothetical protein C1H46_018000 [Malus baccata]